MLQDVSGMTAYLGDVIITGTNQNDLYNKLDMVLQHLSDYSLHIHLDKCSFGMLNIKCSRFIVDKHIYWSKSINTSVINSMPPLHDLCTLQAFFELISYYTVLLHSLHDIQKVLQDAMWLTFHYVDLTQTTANHIWIEKRYPSVLCQLSTMLLVYDFHIPYQSSPIFSQANALSQLIEKLTADKQACNGYHSQYRASCSMGAVGSYLSTAGHSERD